MRKHGAYDIEITGGDEWYGFMLDRSAENADVDVAEEDPTPSINISYGSGAKGDYNWRDQRSMPGVAIADFRGGQGQLLLDREDSAANAFRDGRFLDCTTEGEVKLAPGLLSALWPDIDPVIIEAGGNIFAAFIPGEGASPDSVRQLVRYEVNLEEELIADADETEIVLDDYTDIALGDYLYDPLARELMQVLALYEEAEGELPEVPMEVGRAAGFFDNDPMNPPLALHAADTTLYGYGWRAVTFEAETPPETHCRSLAWDGHRLYAAFSDTSADGELHAWNSTDDEFALLMDDGIDGITDIVWGAGRLYYSAQGAAATTAGYIGYNEAGDALEATQLSASAVVGEEWDGTDHFEKVERKLIEPMVDSKGLTVNNLWCYWLTTGGRNSYLYRMQAPAGFELVKSFPKGFIGTCLVAAFDNVYVGGYYPNADGTVEGAVYLVSGDVTERVIELKDLSMDNTVQGIAVIGMFVYVTTSSQVVVYNPKTAGWWHLMDIPPADPDTSIVPVEESSIDRFYFNLEAPLENDVPETKYPDDWEVLSHSSTEPTYEIDTNSHGQFLFVGGDNCDYIRWAHKPTEDSGFVGTSASLGVMLGYFSVLDYSRGPLPTDGRLSEGKRRVLEMSVCNGIRQARARVTATLVDGMWWSLRYSIGRWNSSRSRWVFENWIPIGYCGHRSFGLSLNEERATFYGTGGVLQEMVASKLKPSATQRIWFSGGIPTGDALYLKDGSWILDENAGITTTKPFRCCIEQVQVLTEDLDQVHAAVPPAETGRVAELDGELFIPIPGIDGSGQLGFTRMYETYAGLNAYLETSDSYQGMGTAKKFYRRVELAHSALQDEQEVDAYGIVDDAYCEPEELTPTGDVTENRFTMRGINAPGIKCRSRVSLSDTEHYRLPEDKLKLNSIAVRFMPNAAALKHIYTVLCIDSVEDRTNSKWPFDPYDAIDFIRRMKRSSAIVQITDDEGTYSGVIDSYQIRFAKKDENAHSTRQGTVQFIVKTLGE